MSWGVTCLDKLYVKGDPADASEYLLILLYFAYSFGLCMFYIKQGAVELLYFVCVCVLYLPALYW